LNHLANLEPDPALANSIVPLITATLLPRR
jgi:hypothetical protein